MQKQQQLTTYNLNLQFQLQLQLQLQLSISNAQFQYQWLAPATFCLARAYRVLHRVFVYIWLSTEVFRIVLPLSLVGFGLSTLGAGSCLVAVVLEELCPVTH